MQPADMLIRRLRVDTDLNDHDAAALRELPISMRDVTPDTSIVREGDRPTQCCLIIKGLACRSKVTESGRCQILSFHIPGDIPDIQSLFLRKMDHDLATVSEATLGFIEHSALDPLIRTSPRVARALWRETLVDASIFREWIVNLGVRAAPARMAHLLAELRERMAAIGLTEGDEFDFPITQAKLAEALGLTPVHVNRVLQEFRAKGVLNLNKSRVKITDLSQVLTAGEFDDSYLHQISSHSSSRTF